MNPTETQAPQFVTPSGIEIQRYYGPETPLSGAFIAADRLRAAVESHEFIGDDVEGRLRVAINVGNPILARRHPESGEPEGVSIDLATQLAQRLGVPLKLVRACWRKRAETRRRQCTFSATSAAFCLSS